MIVRTPRHWLPRLIDALLTLAAWTGFVYLLADGVRPLLANEPHAAHPPLGTPFMSMLSTLLLYLLAGLAIGVALLGWAKYNQIRAARHARRLRAPDLDHAALSRSFGVHPGVLEFLHQHQVLIVFNDLHGDIHAIEFPTLGMRLAARQPGILEIGLEQPSSDALVS